MNGLHAAVGTAAAALGGITIGQLPLTDAVGVGKSLGEMSAVAILGTVAVLSLACVAYLVRIMMTKVMTALEENTKASQRMADAIVKCEGQRRGEGGMK